jgi:hypothetical protein
MSSSLPANRHRHDFVCDLIGTGVSEALYILHALHDNIDRPGDVCEFGVAQGATSLLLANEILGTEKKLWLFDSFQGLPKPTERDELIDDIFRLGSMEAYEGTMAFPETVVLAKLQLLGFPQARLRIVPGFIEQSISRSELPNRVCLAYVDFDLYQPIATALEFLAKAVTPGGVIIVDDYGFFSSGAKAAVDEFLAKQGNRFLREIPFEGAGHFAILQRRPD